MNRNERDDSVEPAAGSDEDERRDGGGAREGARERTAPPAHAYQEGSVESVGGGPSGTDTDDRTGQPPASADASRAPEMEGNRDMFISSEVAEESAAAPGRPERTRS